jgi:hypothetical protein
MAEWRHTEKAKEATLATGDPWHVVWIVLVAVIFCALADPAVSGGLMRKLPWVLLLECGWCRLLTEHTYTTARIILVVCVSARGETIVDTCIRVRVEIFRLVCKCVARAWRKPLNVQIKQTARKPGSKAKRARGRSPAAKKSDTAIHEIDDSECIICLNARKTRLCLPCGHTVICEACNASKTFKECPVCQVTVTQMMRFY